MGQYRCDLASVWPMLTILGFLWGVQHEIDTRLSFLSKSKGASKAYCEPGSKPSKNPEWHIVKRFKFIQMGEENLSSTSIFSSFSRLNINRFKGKHAV